MLRVILLLSFSSFFISCSSVEKKGDTAEALYKRAKEFEEDDRFEEAIRRYQEVRSKFPYSPFAVDAELATADVYYKQESYPEAQAAYQSFRDLHPRHPQISYVLHRYALSLYQQLPETVDRDLSLAPETILAFNDVLKKFPQSEYANEAREKKTELVRKIAEKEIYIADFYYKRKNCVSALPRYEYMLKEYKGLGFEEKSLARAAYCASKNGDPQKARRYAQEVSEFPTKSAETLMILREIR
ncbi:MAG: outer membrane protein assembly factor BamD [Bdellovibrionales bacterium]